MHIIRCTPTGSSNRDEIAAVFNTFMVANSTFIDVITSSQSMPTTVLLSMSNVIAELRRAPRARQLDLVWQAMEAKIAQLADIVAECEKIKCSPLPLSYSRHTSRFFSFFTLTLPFAVVKDTTPAVTPCPKFPLNLLLLAALFFPAFSRVIFRSPWSALAPSLSLFAVSSQEITLSMH